MKQKTTPKRRTTQTAKKTMVRKAVPRKAKQQAKMLLVPHARNDYRPHLVRRGGIVAILLLVVAMQAFYIFTNGGFVLGGKADISTNQLLASTNKARLEHGLAPLEVNSRLTAAANRKAHDMLAADYWAHTSPQGVTPWKWIDDARYKYSYAGENLAKNFATAGGVVTAWMQSEEHRDNMLNSHYRDVGFAVAKGELGGQETTLVVAMYGAPKTTTNLVATGPTVLAATTAGEPIIARIGTKLQLMTPSVLGSVMLLLMASLVAATAHLYRKQLPRGFQRSWRKHHGAYKAVGMVGLAVMLVALYNGGQI